MSPFQPRISNTNTQELFRTLRNYQRGYEVFKRATPSPAAAKIIFDTRLHHLLEVLNKEETKDRINFVLQNGDNSRSWNPFASRGHRDIDFEISLTKLYMLGQGSIKRLEEKDAPENIQLPRSAEALIQDIVTWHTETINSITESRSLDRIPKKKRKRDISRGVTSTALTLGTGIANSHFPAIVQISYAICGVAFMDAYQSFMGEPTD